MIMRTVLVSAVVKNDWVSGGAWDCTRNNCIFEIAGQKSTAQAKLISLDPQIQM